MVLFVQSATGFLFAIFLGTPDGLNLLQNLLGVHILPEAVDEVLKSGTAQHQAGQVMDRPTTPDYPVVRHPVLVVVVGANLLVAEAGTNLNKKINKFINA